eukprot:TRINITY_DN59084_c0_g1_i1.p1 TRINITY_DN59084_c0_g1~~TRINITY_DN59084_c0_g1_i1.p1  ORF type:complete len:222 (-),score=15.31 TRINITY_DN59084_c0_g1_i1:93-758(-)
MSRQPPISTLSSSSAASDVYKRQAKQLNYKIGSATFHPPDSSHYMHTHNENIPLDDFRFQQPPAATPHPVGGEAPHNGGALIIAMLALGRVVVVFGDDIVVGSSKFRPVHPSRKGGCTARTPTIPLKSTHRNPLHPSKNEPFIVDTFTSLLKSSSGVRPVQPSRPHMDMTVTFSLFLLSPFFPPLPVSSPPLLAHETPVPLLCRLLLEPNNRKKKYYEIIY